MRNLKKILALVLALIMSLSLMATAGAGSFQDVTDDNPYKTAIDVLDGLKVFQGFEDGTFKPTDTLNRAQAAVLVYRIATGDVENKYLDNYTYMAQSKFNDLDGYNWAKGYINYCQNAGIVVGTSATTFNPGAPVTGYQLMVMLLRTLGYGKAGEFTDPKGWELQTASIAEREGLLKNVTGGDFGAPAPRQMVAEILFRGLLHETMQYSPLTPDGYTKSGETLGKRVGLSEVEGVVLANEYASLNDTDVLAEGKTQLDDNLIDYTTDFDDIGERKLAYLKDGKTVLSIADSSKNTREFTLDESSLKDLLKKANLNAGDAEHFINFAEVDKYTTPYRIRYVLQVEDDGNGTKVLVGDNTEIAQEVADAIAAANSDAVVDYTEATSDAISVTLKPKSEVSKVDRDWMKWIFADGDLNHAADSSDPDEYEVGEIYVNTQSTKDISDDPDYYYEKFEETFLTYDDNKTIIDGNEKGNWLKVIDNDADGKADYILKVIYTGAQVERIKNDKITLDVKNHALLGVNDEGDAHDRLSDGVRDNEVNTLTNQTVVNMSDEDLAEGDVVYYAIIDGVARTYKAEMVTATIDKINRNTKSTTTDDGDEYFESAVCNHILDPEYDDEVTDLVGKVSFDLFFDRGGYLLTFIKSNRSGDFKLITDGWFNSTKSGYEYAARVYNDDEGKQEIIDLASGGSKFIGRDVLKADGTTTDNNDWQALKYLGGADEENNGGALDAFITNANPFKVAALNGGVVTDPTNKNSWANKIKTTVASIDEEGNILPVEDYAITGRYAHAMIELGNDKIPTSAYTKGWAYTTDGDTAYNLYDDGDDGDSRNDAEVELRALNTTKYYVVWPSGSGVGVKAFTGYGSAGDIVKLASNRGSKGLELVEDIYAVGTQTIKENDHRDEDVYYTADIVVVELNAAPTSARDIVLLVDDEGQVTSTGLRHVQVIEPDGSSKWIDVKNNPNLTLARDNYEKKIQPGLYFREEAGDEVYALTAMTPADILAADCFITGQVQTVVKTGKQDYVIVNPADTKTILDEDNDKVIVDEVDENTVQPIITEDAKFYTLGYGGATTSYYKQHAANLSDEDAEDYRTVLNSKVEGVEKGSDGDPALNRDFYLERDKTSYFYNDVLIRYNSDNEIVWAVSFQNTFDSKGTRDYAQEVWENVVPEAVEDDAGELTVSFKVKTTVGDLTAGDVVATVKVAEGENAEIAKTALDKTAEGYTLGDVQINGINVSSDASNYYVLNVTEDTDVDVTYTLLTKKLTVQASADTTGKAANILIGGTAASASGNDVQVSKTVAVTFTATAGYTYTYSSTELDATNVEITVTGTEGRFEVTMPNEAATITITHAAKPTLTVTATANNSVVTFTAPDGFTSGNTINQGDAVTFTVKAQDNNKVTKVEWQVMGSARQEITLGEPVNGTYTLSLPAAAVNGDSDIDIFVTTESTAPVEATIKAAAADTPAAEYSLNGGKTWADVPANTATGDDIKISVDREDGVIIRSKSEIKVTATATDAPTIDPTEGSYTVTVSNVTEANTALVVAAK